MPLVKDQQLKGENELGDVLKILSLEIIIVISWLIDYKIFDGFDLVNIINIQVGYSF